MSEESPKTKPEKIFEDVQAHERTGFRASDDTEVAFVHYEGGTDPQIETKE